MNATAAPTPPAFEIIPATNGQGWLVIRNGVPLTTTHGQTRVFSTHNSARKRVSREKRGDFHR